MAVGRGAIEPNFDNTTDNTSTVTIAAATTTKTPNAETKVTGDSTDDPTDDLADDSLNPDESDPNKFYLDSYSINFYMSDDDGDRLSVCVAPVHVGGNENVLGFDVTHAIFDASSHQNLIEKTKFYFKRGIKNEICIFKGKIVPTRKEF